MVTEAIELWKQKRFLTSWMNFDAKTEKIWSATHSSSTGLWRSSLSQAEIPTIPNKDPWSCEEYTLNLNHSTWGYLKTIPSPQKARRRTAQMCPSHQTIFFADLFLLAKKCQKQKFKAPFLKLPKCETNDQTSAWLTTMPLHCNSSRQGKSSGTERKCPSDSK